MAEDDYAQWLTPIDALARLDASLSEQTKRDWILRRLQSGRIRASAHGSLIPQHLWKKPWHWFDSSFWQTSDLTFFNTPPDVFGRPIPGIRGDTRAYQDVRFDPAAFPAAVRPTTELRAEGGKKGGRYMRHHGGVIAATTKRLLALSPEERQRYEPRTLEADLIKEYRNHGSAAPSAANLTLLAAGILKEVQK